MVKDAIADYLSTYAEPNLEPIPNGTFDEVVVLPCHGEDTLVDGTLESLHKAASKQSKHALVIVVINDGPKSSAIHSRTNQQLLRRLPTVTAPWPALTILIVDRTLKHETGVGGARKIGSDLALALYATKRLRSDLIHTTDADARVAPDFFDCRPTTSQPRGLGPLPIGAIIHPFVHEENESLGEAIGLYDQFLRYYCMGLAWAGSPYAFPTIGSTVSFSPLAYAQVRGFPAREAAEDFYFLQKIAKVAFVWPGGGQVLLAPRRSDRVPFGTGQSVMKIEQLLAEGGAYQVYDPRVFVELKEWLRAVEAMADGADWLHATDTLSKPALQALASQGAIEASDRIAATRTSRSDKLRHWHTWFDGFKTRKFVHCLRDSAYPNVDLAEALAPLASPDGFSGLDHRRQSTLGVLTGQPL